MEYFLEHYSDYKSEKVQELEDIKRLIEDKEERWLALNTELENENQK
jgi:hypothetical protein